MSPRQAGWSGILWALVMIVSGVVPLSAQEITEAWVAEQLGGSRLTERRAPSGAAEHSLPIVSVRIRYRPATGELTLSSAAALQPLYKALHALAPTPFRVVCCTGLPPNRQATLAQQLVKHLSQLFAERQLHVQFQIKSPSPSVSPQAYAVDTALIDIYRLP
ncbi:MAG: hypothetical protein ETSY1_05500 [Candidatus Entotheonella factor]|uniref:Uncharacterized protein n=1 Tax=Entotheonella factor TaxID=1429438 RepID=W4LX12_ENTF1|nr:MAG: hypothetical protein ETSY1_05500 [Candidatus Entotheonella factor]